MSESTPISTDIKPPQAAVPSTLGRHSDLKVTALEFKPPLPRPPQAPPLQVDNDFQSLNLGDESEQYGEDGYGYDHHEENTWGGDTGDRANGNYGSGASLWGAAPPQTAPFSGPENEAAALAVLSQQFPEYSSAAISSLFSQCGRSMQSTMQMLFSMEAELSGQTYKAPVPVAKPPPEANFTNDDFPTLGGGSAPKQAASGTVSTPFGGNFAGRAKAAAALPVPVAATSKEAAWSIGGGSGGGGNLGPSKAAPVWQSSGIERFATGIAVAAEYADRRSDARDHARLRNQCFQNATQAYMAGNKALAKELGAKGRWHNEQMKAAHASAAEDTFSQRNAAALNASGGVPTIDLHGLHVTEALHHLESALERLQRQGVRSVRVVVGVGQHGKVPARLPAAIRSFLSDRRLSFREPYAGMLEVALQ